MGFRIMISKRGEDNIFIEEGKISQMRNRTRISRTLKVTTIKRMMKRIRTKEKMRMTRTN